MDPVSEQLKRIADTLEHIKTYGILITIEQTSETN